jgi:single-stranded DNA-binding protein
MASGPSGPTGSRSSPSTPSRRASRSSKGDLVGVVGRLRSNTWEKDGVSRTTVEVVAQNVEFLRLKDREAAQ